MSAPAVTCFIRLAEPCVIPTIKPHGPCNSPWNGSETKSLRPDPSACAKPPGDPSISNDPTTQPGARQTFSLSFGSLSKQIK